MIDLSATRLRSSPRFRLIPFDQLETRQREALESLGEGADFYGVLLPPAGSALPVKSVSRDAALLFMALCEPACLPHLLTRLFGKRANERLRPLILDGVFEVENDGRFVSGPAAMALLDDRDNAAPKTRLAQLSHEAIAYAGALEALPVPDVANRLYLFNTMPATPAWLQRLGDDPKFDAFLYGNGSARHVLQSLWHREAVGASWIVWNCDQEARSLPYKLYVSPAPEQLPELFEAAVDVFAKACCRHFKVGRGALGALRPDKLVAYFDNLGHLHQAAEWIRTVAGGSPVQGVPFTAPIDPEGLLSWGMDPPRFEQVLAHQQDQSWRQWLTGRIAVCIGAAKEAGADVQAFVRGRIALDGVNPETWNPDLAIWRGPVGTGQGVS